MNKKSKEIRKVPNLRFPEFEGEWKQTTLGKCSESLEYGMNSSAIAFDGKNKYIRITDIDEDSSKYTPNVPVSPKSDLQDKYLVKENDILLARTGASTGKGYLYNTKDGRLYFAGFLIKVKINNANNANFIFNQTKTDHYQKWVKIMSIRSGQPGINSKEYAGFKFWAPSKPEQNQIASFLSLVDERIATQNKIIGDYKLLKKGMMQKIFKQEVRLKDENCNLYPEWQEKSLGSLTNKKGKKNRENNQYPIYSINNKEGFLPQEEQFEGMDSNSRGYDISLYKIINKNTFAYNPARINVGSIGYSGELENIIISSLYVCFQTTNELVDEYLLQYLKTYDFTKSVLRNVEGGVREYLFYENFSSIKIPLPCLKEQQKIASAFSTFDKKITVEEDYLEKLQAQKKYLLQNLFI